MDRIVHKTRSAREADAWDIAQYRGLAPSERLEMARVLRERVYGTEQPDVRDARLVRRTRLSALL